MITLPELQATVDHIDRTLALLATNMYLPPILEQWEYEVTGIDIGSPGGSINAIVAYRLLNDGGEYTAEIVRVWVDEWVRLSAPIEHEIHEAFYEDWRQGKVRFEI